MAKENLIIVKVIDEVVDGIQVVATDIVKTIPGVESAVPAYYDGFGHHVSDPMREVHRDDI